jgi:hypothetical protein
MRERHHRARPLTSGSQQEQDQPSRNEGRQPKGQARAQACVGWGRFGDVVPLTLDRFESPAAKFVGRRERDDELARPNPVTPGETGRRN